MLILKPQVRVIYRDTTSTTGEVVRAFFAVINIAGSIEVKFLGTKIIEQTISENSPVALLENIAEQFFGERVVPFLNAIVSPFIPFNFSVNQLARAPSFN